MRLFKFHPLLKLVNSYVVDSPQPSNLTYWWNFGSLLALSLVIQIITGVTLAMHYDSDISKAFDSVEQIMRDINNGWLIRYLHSNTASAFFFIVYLHIGRGLYYGSYKTPRTLVWTIGTIILILMMATAFLGYVLPFGQMSLWGATVITSLMSAIPWIGQDIVEFIWGGFSINHATLSRFFALHFVLPFILAGLALMHLLTLHEKAGSGNPLGISSNSDKIPFAPYYIFKDLITIFIYILVLSIFVFYMPNVLGDSENYVKANPMKTPPAIVPEWYLLSFYAILRSIPNKLLGVIAMFSAILMLLALTFTDISKLRGIQFKPLNKITLFFFVSTFLVLTQLGAKHVESPFIEFGQICTILYFAYFLMVVPYVFLFEKAVGVLQPSKYTVKNTVSKDGNKEEVIIKIDALTENNEEKKDRLPEYAIMQSNLFAGYNFLSKKNYCNNLHITRNFSTSPCLNDNSNSVNDHNNAIQSAIIETATAETATAGTATAETNTAPVTTQSDLEIVEKTVADCLPEFVSQTQIQSQSDNLRGQLSSNNDTLPEIVSEELTRIENESNDRISDLQSYCKDKITEHLTQEGIEPQQAEEKAQDVVDNLTDECVRAGILELEESGAVNNVDKIVGNIFSADIDIYFMDKVETQGVSNNNENDQSVEDEDEDNRNENDQSVRDENSGNSPPESKVEIEVTNDNDETLENEGHNNTQNNKRSHESDDEQENPTESYKKFKINDDSSPNEKHEDNLPESSLDAPRPWGIYFQDSGTSQMEILTELHDNILFFLIIILFGVAWLLLTIINKFSNMAWPLSQRFTSHGTTIEIIWTITPGIILILIAFPSFKLLYLMDEITDPILVIQGEGHQWYWSYQYIDFMNDEGELLEFDSYLVPESDLQKGALRMLEVDNRLVLPELTHTRFVVSGADVIHSFACPALGLKCDAYPGRTNQLSLMINRAGTFFGQCSEICGLYHSGMPIVFEAVSVEKFIEWTRQS